MEAPVGFEGSVVYNLHKANLILLRVPLRWESFKQRWKGMMVMRDFI